MAMPHHQEPIQSRRLAAPPFFREVMASERQPHIMLQQMPNDTKDTLNEERQRSEVALVQVAELTGEVKRLKDSLERVTGELRVYETVRAGVSPHRSDWPKVRSLRRTANFSGNFQPARFHS